MSQSKGIGDELEFLTACLIGHFVRIQTKSMLLVGILRAASVDKDYGLVISLLATTAYTGMVQIFWKDIVFVDVQNAFVDLDNATLLKRCREIGLIPSLPKDSPTYPVPTHYQQRPMPIAQPPRPGARGIVLHGIDSLPPVLHSADQMRHYYVQEIQSNQQVPQAQSSQQVPQTQQVQSNQQVPQLQQVQSYQEVAQPQQVQSYQEVSQPQQVQSYQQVSPPLGPMQMTHDHQVQSHQQTLQLIGQTQISQGQPYPQTQFDPAQMQPMALGPNLSQSYNQHGQGYRQPMAVGHPVYAPMPQGPVFWLRDPHSFRPR